MAHGRTEVRSDLHHLAQVIAQGLQVVHNVGAVTEEVFVDACVGNPRHHPLQ